MGPRQRPLVLLHLHVPLLCPLLEIVGRHPSAFFWHDPLLLEEGLAWLRKTSGSLLLL